MTQDPNSNPYDANDPYDPYGQPSTGDASYGEPAEPSYGEPAGPSYGQPSYGQPAYGQTYASPAPQVQDPGQVLGIVSLVASLATFIGFGFVGPVVGIICGALARKKSREAGLADNGLGKWGFILGIIFLALSVLVLVLIIVGAFASAAADYSSSLLGAL